jgi:hypothetical protein
MKRLLFLSLLLIHSAAGGIEKGASRTAVLAELGEPDGSMQRNGKEILLYKTGTVTLQGGLVIGTDLSQEYARKAEERALNAEKIRAEKQAELERRKLLYPEDHIIQIECAYDKTENWDYLPESIRPATGQCLYDVYIPQGYHESDRSYKCLFLETPALWDSVKERIRKEKWIVVVLQEAAGPQIGKTLNGNFLAAFDDATERFRISKSHIFIAGRVPAAIFATMRPVAGIILQNPDFNGLQKNGITLDFLRKSPDLRVYVLLSNKDRDNVLFQAKFIVTRIPKYHIEVYEDGAEIQPQFLADGAIEWMKKEYSIH